MQIGQKTTEKVYMIYFCVILEDFYNHFISKQF